MSAFGKQSGVFGRRVYSWKTDNYVIFLPFIELYGFEEQNYKFADILDNIFWMIIVFFENAFNTIH